MELLVVFLIIFIIYGAGWIWQAVQEIFRDSQREPWNGTAVLQGRAPRSLGGRSVAELGQAFRIFAEGRRAELSNPVWHERLKASYRHNGASATLLVAPSGDSEGGYHSELILSMPDGWTRRLDLYPQRRPERGELESNLFDLRIGDPDFDPRWVIRADDEGFLKEFLDPAIRQVLEDLRNLSGTDQVTVSVNVTRLQVRKDVILKDADELDVFASLGGRLYDRLNLLFQRASGIEILDEPATLEPSTCQVCGTAVTPETRVVCRRCRTPHHRDCWEFSGKCSTYACGEKQFTTKPN